MRKFHTWDSILAKRPRNQVWLMRLPTRALLARRGLFRCGGEEAVEIGIAEGVEGVGVFGLDDGGFGEDAVFEGVEASGGFALGGAGSGRFGCVATVRVD